MDTQAAHQQKRTQVTISEHIVEIVSDSGEGAQTAGQLFGTICAKMGNGVWTVEIIPAEIQPPARSRAGASGNRIRIGTDPITNAGDCADLVIAFNEQVLYSRIEQGALGPGTRILLDNKWSWDPVESIREAYQEAREDFASMGYSIYEVPIESECFKVVADPKKGKNIWVLGLLCSIYQRDLDLVKKELAKKFKRKGQEAIDRNLELLQAGYDWAESEMDVVFDLPTRSDDRPKLVMNGNQAIALGCMAAGIEVCSMYPITPATSVSHALASMFHKVGGFVHQAEDEIAAIGFAVGASYAGKTALTVTSGPGLALKTEFIGLAVMAEVPLVIIDVQRGGPSTGLPTKVEQSDLLAAYFASPGDAPKIIMAPSTIEECYHFVPLARKLAELFRGPVFVLTDANLATGVQPFLRPELSEDTLSPPIDQNRWNPEIKPYEWDQATGLSPRPVPGQRDGMYTLTGLAHDERSRVAYDSSINQRATERRSSKLKTLRATLKPPQVFGDESGDLLVVGWGSTRGAIEEAVTKLQGEGHSVSALHLRFLSPLEPGLNEIFSRFKHVMTIEINYSDDGHVSDRRFAQLAWLLRNETLIDVDCWSRVQGYPLPPSALVEALREKLGAYSEGAVS
ncbi:MAG: 2-oxoacid:acceptor oxidoreductase subunit alpha [Acidobacteria bacterium]|nr:2-oxoacid:acceptor oxidoreductase subunit alpha [Acidobacteriota bacterium]